MSRRDQTRFVAEPPQDPRPMISRPTGLDPDKARRQRGEKRLHLGPSESLAELNLSLAIDAVNMENVLGDVEPNNANVHLDGLLGPES